MHVKAVHTSIFQKNDDIFSFIINHVPRLNERDIIVITSKIVALSEGVVIPKAQKRKFLESISTKMIETPWAIRTCIDDEWTINAGVDESNAKQGLIVLPNDSHKTAHILLTKLKKSYFYRFLLI